MNPIWLFLHKTTKEQKLHIFTSLPKEVFIEVSQTIIVTLVTTLRDILTMFREEYIVFKMYQSIITHLGQFSFFRPFSANFFFRKTKLNSGFLKKVFTQLVQEEFFSRVKLFWFINTFQNFQ